MIPTTVELITRLLLPAGAAKIDPALVAESALREIENGGTLASFTRWCRSQAALAPASSELMELLWWSSWRISYAERDRLKQKEPGYEEIASVFPFRTINSFGCRVGGHSLIDGFCALRQDPLWQQIEPPFDWLCSCTVLSYTATDPDISDDAGLPARDRLDSKFIRTAEHWFEDPPGSF